MTDPSKGRTAKEAVVQANAKYRIRWAVHVRRVGFLMTVYGFYELTRVRAWHEVMFPGSFQVHIHGGPTVIVTWRAAVGVALIVLGPLTSATGYWLEARAVRVARSNPVTAQIFSQPKSFYK